MLSERTPAAMSASCCRSRTWLPAALEMRAYPINIVCLVNGLTLLVNSETLGIAASCTIFEAQLSILTALDMLNRIQKATFKIDGSQLDRNLSRKLTPPEHSEPIFFGLSTC